MVNLVFEKEKRKSLAEITMKVNIYVQASSDKKQVGSGILQATSPKRIPHILP